jgi:hypothetical protein
MTYNQKRSHRRWTAEGGEISGKRGLHKTVNAYCDDVWHSVWKRIEEDRPVDARPASLPRPRPQAPLDYVAERG